MTSKKHKHIAYNALKGNSPTIMFCGGFRSDMTGSKAMFLEKTCAELGLSFLRFDYSGHGESDGDFKDCTISQWRYDTMLALDELTQGDVILVGSSMGAWLAMHAAINRPERIKAFIGIAAAPDFTQDLMWNIFDDFTKQKIQRDGFITMPNCYDGEEEYIITHKLIEDGRKNLLLDKPIEINCPVRLLQGMADADVPYQTASKIAEKLTSDDVQIHLLKNSDHRMSGEKELQLLRETLISLI